jgi:hypothetical protein
MGRRLLRLFKAMFAAAPKDARTATDYELSRTLFPAGTRCQEAVLVDIGDAHLALIARDERVLAAHA